MIARALLNAEAIIQDGRLDRVRVERYARWSEGLGAELLGGCTLAEAADMAESRSLAPRPRSGGQERLENIVNRFC